MNRLGRLISQHDEKRIVNSPLSTQPCSSSGSAPHVRTNNYVSEPTPEHRIFVLYYAIEMKEIAHKLAAGDSRIVLGDTVWNRENDQFPKVSVKRAWNLKRAHVAFLASFHTPNVIFEQMSIIQTIPSFGVHSFKVIVPWFPTGTMERVSQFGEIATAKTLSRILSTTPPTVRGPSQVILLDIHALVNQFYFEDSVQVNLRSMIPLLFKAIREWNPPNLAIAFPDDGAYKRYQSRFTQFPKVVCQKIRLGDQRIVTIKEGSPEGMHCLIVDDLVQSGGTLLKCQKALKAAGASAVSCYVTHAVFPGEAW